MMKILVLGATGMLGSAVYTVLARSSGYSVYGSIRSADSLSFFGTDIQAGLISITNLEDVTELQRLLDHCAPDVVINCLSVNKPFPNDPIKMISIFALLPKHLSLLCSIRGIRLLQISTDGVFSGSRGNYSETDTPDSKDIYGIAKFLGEPEGVQVVTLRTSIIGPELRGSTGLLEWFLSQKDRCFAYPNVVFSALPTNVLAEIIRDKVLSRSTMSGVYNIASLPTSKLDLLEIIKSRYEKRIELVPDTKFVSDRSLDTSLFSKATGYQAPSWGDLVESMYRYHQSIKQIK